MCPAADVTTHQFVFSRGGSHPLYGEVGDGMEGQIDQLTPEVVLVEVTENGFVGQLCDGVNEATGGLVLEEDQKWTEKKKKEKEKEVKQLRNISCNS